MNKEYISLREAAKYSKYSSDYLKLRARQGKLKAVKLGRNWFTTREWLEAYEKQVSNENLRNKDKNFSLFSSSAIHCFKFLFIRVIITFFIFGILTFLALIFKSDLELFLNKTIPTKVINIERKID